MQAPSRRTFGGFVFKNLIFLGIAFAIAYVGASFLLANIGWAIVPIAAVLPPPANDPFWILWISVYGLISLALMAFRYKTGSRI